MANEPLQWICPHCGATNEGGRFCSACGKSFVTPGPEGTGMRPVSVQEELAKLEALLAEATKREEALKLQMTVLQKQSTSAVAAGQAHSGQDAESRIKATEDRAKKLEAEVLAKSQELEKLAKELASVNKGGVKGWAIKSIAGVLIAGSSLGGGYKWGQYHPPAGPSAPKGAATPAAGPVKHSPTPPKAVAAKTDVVQPAPEPKHERAKPVAHATPAPKVVVQTFTLDLETKRDDTIVSVGDGKISSDDKKTRFTPNGPVPAGHYQLENTNTSTRGPKVQIDNPAKANGWFTKLMIHGKGKLTVTMEWKPI